MANHNGKQRAEGNSSAKEFDEGEQSYEEWAFQYIDAYYDAAIEEEKECWRLLHASQDSAAAVEDDGFIDGESDEEFSYIDPMIAPPVNEWPVPAMHLSLSLVPGFRIFLVKICCVSLMPTSGTLVVTRVALLMYLQHTLHLTSPEDVPPL
ncbi:uncharacterized protein STEHIDRAFT_162953 [Stereum hirsutum FP-91666 SS1]|uniref:Uncharacterized protein n=1 Tax=Stereum hirsutum (strain FP-91666) TaxID=721885 RepID=R7RZ14_STEHR|nr:uncharacterized protein STEHIDRAFT_162953 [Stereum hirsutum FP-91666 SS1]EIM80068.1 hypothetical protein STEHIDRAFT_162953 [Stereum hirsutum FP-91666 SS1]